MLKKISLVIFALFLFSGLGFWLNESSKEYIGGNQLNLLFLSARDSEFRIVAPWINNGLISHLLYRTVLTPDHTLADNYKPDLASKVDILEDGFLYKVHFNAGNKWSDGTLITPEDLLFSIERVLVTPRINALYTRLASLVESMEVEDNILNIRLKEKSSLFLPALAQLAVMPKHIVQDIAIEEFLDSDFWLSPVVSGMYKVEDFEDKKYFHLVQNELYNGKKSKIEDIFLVCSDYKEIKIDYYITNNISEMINYRAMRGFTEELIDMLFYRYLVFNVEDRADGINAAMHDKRVREAICMAIDREALLHHVYFNAGNIVDGAGHVNAKGSYNYNPQRAKQLIEESGYDLNRPLRFGVYYTDQTSRYFMLAAAGQLEEVGFKVEIVNLSTQQALYVDKQYDLFLKGLASFQTSEWFNEYSSANEFMHNLFGKNTEMDKYITDIREASDIVKYNEILDTMVALEEDLLFKFPLFTLSQSVYIHTERVKLPKDFKHGNFHYIFDFDFANWEIKKQ